MLTNFSFLCVSKLLTVTIYICLLIVFIYYVIFSHVQFWQKSLMLLFSILTNFWNFLAGHDYTEVRWVFFNALIWVN